MKAAAKKATVEAKRVLKKLHVPQVRLTPFRAKLASVICSKGCVGMSWVGARSAVHLRVPASCIVG
eukprot:scaffold665757_cov57-Prasinocladus_malaysianus.AAC.1